jgi:hypothetical protein
MDFITGALKSKTVQFSGAVVALGVLEQTSGLFTAMVPEEYRGIAIAAIGLMSAVLRFVTTKPISEK